MQATQTHKECLEKELLAFKIPIVEHYVTLNVCPDIAVAYEFGGCTKRCKGCHSEHLHKEVENPLEISYVIEHAKTRIASGVKVIALMGIDTSSMFPVEHQVRLCEELSKIAPLCIYSGNKEIDSRLLEVPNIKYCKTGEYIEELGGMEQLTSNQRLYQFIDNNIIDITYKMRGRISEITK